MRVIGIIAEFNPFHNGHEYLISKARELVNDDRAIVMCVISGPFTQRGLPALMPKHARAAQALKCGADIVLELPFTFACAPSERFAFGGIELLMRTGVMTDLAFGIDCDDFSVIEKLSSVDFDSSEDYKNALRDNLASGMSFPAARAQAICSVSDIEDKDMLLKTLRMPNSILALDYLRAVKRIGKKINIHPIKRIGEGYSSSELAAEFPSATAIREFCLKNGSSTAALTALNGKMPVKALAKMLADLSEGRYRFPDMDLYASLLFNSVPTLNADAAYMGDGLNGHISNTVEKIRSKDFSFEKLTRELNTKHFTDGRILRALASNLTGQSEEFVQSCKHVPYIRVLGFNKEGRYCLKIMGKCARVPIIHNCSDFLEIRSSRPEEANTVFELDRRAYNIQALLMGSNPNSDFENSPVQVK